MCPQCVPQMNKINFTKASIVALPVPTKGKRTEVWDNKTTGLQIRITSMGVKTFYVKKRIKNGEVERISIGRFPDVTIEQARRKATEINLAIADGKNPAEIKRGKKAELTFAELFEQYYERHALPSKRTASEDKGKYEKYLKKPLCNKKISEIKRADIATIHSKITRAGYPTTANRVKALISSIFGWAITVGLMETNPALGVRSNREKSRDRFLQTDELPRFFNALREEANDVVRDYFLLSLLTGARRSNVLSMKWDDISFEKGEWYIERTKNGEPQTVVLTDEAMAILESRRKHKSSSIFVLPSRASSSGHLEEARKGWKRVLDCAGITELRVHDLRRTVGSWQAKQGSSLSIIGKSLNHKNIATTTTYARLDLVPVRESMSKATAAIVAAANVEESPKIIKLDKRK